MSERACMCAETLVFVLCGAYYCSCSRAPAVLAVRRHFTVLQAPLSSNSTGTSFPVTFSRTCWRRRQLPSNKLATSYEEGSDTPDHLDMSRWSESRQLPRNFLVTSWRLPRNICYGEVTGKLVPMEFELYSAPYTGFQSDTGSHTKLLH